MSIISRFKKSGPPIVVAVGDTHTNSHSGLLPPSVELSDGSKHISNIFQNWLWDKWLRFWGEMGEIKNKSNSPLIAIFNGDSVDKNRFSKEELISHDPNDILLMAADALAPALDVADVWYVVRGTPVHTGEGSWLEEALARDIGAKPENENNHSWWSLNLHVNGVRFNVQHTPESNSTRPWTLGAGALRIAKIVMDNYYDTGDPPPHIVVRNHKHHWEDSGTNHFSRAFILPAWQGDTTFVHKIGIGAKLPLFGGVAFICHNNSPEKPYDVIQRTYRAKRKEPEII